MPNFSDYYFLKIKIIHPQRKLLGQKNSPNQTRNQKRNKRHLGFESDFFADKENQRINRPQSKSQHQTQENTRPTQDQTDQKTDIDIPPTHPFFAGKINQTKKEKPSHQTAQNFV